MLILVIDQLRRVFLGDGIPAYGSTMRIARRAITPRVRGVFHVASVSAIRGATGQGIRV